MNEQELRSRLASLAAEAVPAPRRLPSKVAQRAGRTQLRYGLTAASIAISLSAGIGYTVWATGDVVGPAPMAGGHAQGPIDPPDSGGYSGFSITAYAEAGRVCGTFELGQQTMAGEDSETNEICDPDPTETIAVRTQSVFLGAEGSTELVIIAGGASSEIETVEISLAGRRLRNGQVALMPVDGVDRKLIGYAADREEMLDKKGRFKVTLFAFDTAGKLITERKVCDPQIESERC